MKQKTSAMTSRQIFLLLGVAIFAIAGFVQFVRAVSSSGWDDWLAPVLSWTLAFLAYRQFKKLGEKGGNEA